MSSIVPYVPSRAERLADNTIHVVGVTSGLAASIALAIMALQATQTRWPTSIGI